MLPNILLKEADLTKILKFLKITFIGLAVLIVLMIIPVVTLLLWPITAPPTNGVNQPFAITNINIINVHDGSIQPDKTLLIKNGEIRKIVSSIGFNIPGGFTKVPAKGKYLIPGLWDMHTHSIKISPQLHHPLFIANGVTGVRDMSGCMSEDDSFWGCINDRLVWTQEALIGQRVSPRYVLQSSYQTDGGSEVPDDFPSFFSLDRTVDAQKLINFYQSAGADFIKVHHKIPLDKYDALVSAAKYSGLKIAGHQPLEVSLEHAIESGQTSIEHGRVFLLECYQEINKYQTFDNPLPFNDGSFWRGLIDSQNQSKCEALMQTLAKSETWWVPTMTTLASAAFAFDEKFINDPRLQYIPYFIQKILWSQDIKRAQRLGLDGKGQYVHKDLYQLALQQLGKANESGVKILAGTDTLDSYVFAGSSLHDELEAMVSAGLSPLQALQSATISAARFSQLNNKFGSIDVGMAADLLVLNANPLENISNTKNIENVFFNGINYDKAELKQLKQYTAEQAQSIQINLRFASDMLSSPLMRMQLAD